MWPVLGILVEGGCGVGAGVRLDQAPVYSDLVLRCPGARSWAGWEDYLLTEKQLLGRVTLPLCASVSSPKNED